MVSPLWSLPGPPLAFALERKYHWLACTRTILTGDWTEHLLSLYSLYSWHFWQLTSPSLQTHCVLPTNSLQPSCWHLALQGIQIVCLSNPALPAPLPSNDSFYTQEEYTRALTPDCCAHKAAEGLHSQMPAKGGASARTEA